MDLCTTTVFRDDPRRLKIMIELSIEKIVDHLSPITALSDIKKEYSKVLEENFNELGIFNLFSYTVSPMVYDPMTFSPKYGLVVEGGYTNAEDAKKLGYNIQTPMSVGLINLVESIIRNNFRVKKFED